MNVKNICTKYMLELIKRYDTSPALNIPGASKGAQFVRLHDVYTQLPIVNYVSKTTNCSWQTLRNNPVANNDALKSSPTEKAKAITELYLSSPGGGKTAFLKMQAIISPNFLLSNYQICQSKRNTFLHHTSL